MLNALVLVEIILPIVVIGCAAAVNTDRVNLFASSAESSFECTHG